MTSMNGQLVYDCTSRGFACWQDEDFIGKCSRLARTCGPQKLTTRCMEKMLGMYKRQLESS